MSRPFFGTPNISRSAFALGLALGRMNDADGEIGSAGSATPLAARRARAAAAWPKRPSISPRRTQSCTISLAATWSSTRIHVRTRRKVKTERPPVERAVPPVGSVWFGPAP